MQIRKRNQLMVGATALGALVATATTAHAEETGRRVEKIPFQTKTQNDPTLPKGERKVIQKGVEGEKEIVTTQDSTTVKSRKPADVVIILDGSTSMSGNYLKSLRAAQALVNSLSDDDRVIVAMYTANTAESYIAGNNDYQGGTTVALTKAQALDGINKLMAGNPSNARGDLNDFLGAFGGKIDPALQTEQIGTTALREPKSGTKTPMEELIQKQRRANTTLSIAQFTDGWETQETIDTSFVDYAKKNAKTFMSIVFPTGGNATADNAFGSAAKMTAAGHPNVYKAVDDSKVAADVVKQFENTAIDVIKGEPKTTEKVIKQPVDEIIAVGTKEADPTKRTEEIPFKTVTRDDPSLPKGERKVIQKGENGLREFTTTPGSSTTSTRKPVDVIVPYDVSGSTSGGESELDHLEAVAKQGADDTRYMIIGYDEGNSEDGFMTATNGKTQGGSTFRKGAKLSKITKMLSKQQILDFVAKVRELKPRSNQDGSWPWDKAMKALNLYDPTYMNDDGTTKQAGVTYEALFDQARDKNKEVGILWFTDEWEPTEKLDTSFFDWAQKNHGDHFLTVVYGGEGSKSYQTLKAAGQKEILTTAGKDKTALAKEIADKFTSLVTITTPGKDTTTEKVIKQPVDEIIAIGTQEAAKSERKVIKIPFKTVEEEDENLNEGVRKVVRPGVEGEKEIITTTIPASAPSVVKTASGTVDFDIKAGTSTSKETTRKPVDLLAIIDTSSSMVENYGRALTSAEDLVKSMNDTDQITFAHYQTNGLNSYNTGNGKADGDKYNSQPMLLGAMTGPMTKQQALKYLNNAKAFKVGANGVSFPRFIDAQEKLGYKFNKADGKGFQDVYMEHHKADSTISVIQFTDGWMNTENIDTDFTTWASKNAKTFMTVTFKNNSGANGGPTDYSVSKMTAAGHTNIYDERKEAIDDAKIVKQFESTATEKVTVTKQDVNIDVALTIPAGAKLESAQLTTPNGPVQLTVNGNVASYSGKKVPDGHYTLTYKVSGNDGDVKVVVTQDGKELLSKTNTLTGGTANSLRLAKNSTAKDNGDGTYTQTMTLDYDPDRDGNIVASDVGVERPDKRHMIAAIDYQGNKTTLPGTFSLKGPTGAEYIDPKTGRTFLEDIPYPKGTYTLTYTFRLQAHPVAGDMKVRLEIGKAKAEKVDTFEEVPQQPATPAKTTTTENIIKQPVDEIVHIGIGGQVTESKKEPIPFATEIIEDESMMEGEEKVTVEGMIGEKEILTTYKTRKGQKVGNPISTTEHVMKHMRTKIIHRGVKGSVTEKENVELPYTTKLVEDDSLPLGEQKVVQAGSKGNKEITRTWTTQRKLKVGDPTTSEKVTKEPVEEIIHVGTREGVMDTEYEVIPYETRYVDDPLLEAGKEVVVVEGVNGQKAINKFYSLAKGKVVSEIDAQTHVLRHPTDKVIHRGTGVKPEAPKVETPKVETPKVEEPKVETPKVEEPKVETPKVETPKVEEPKVETPKVEEPKVETPTVEEPKVETPKVEEPKVETPKVETPKVETPKVETPKVETPKIEPKVETPKVEAPKVETPKVETPKVETPKATETKQAQSAKELPKTGDAGLLANLFGTGSIALGGLSIRRKRRK